MREASAVQLSGGSRASRQPIGAQAREKGFWSSARVLERLELSPASPAPPSPEPEDQPAAKRRAYEPFEQALQDDLQRSNLQPAPHMVGGLGRAAYLGHGGRGGGGRGGRSGSRLAAAEAVATSADEEVVCEGEKTREERDAELRGEAVSLDE